MTSHGFFHTVRFGMALCILDVLDYFNLVKKRWLFK